MFKVPWLNSWSKWCFMTKQLLFMIFLKRLFLNLIFDPGIIQGPSRHRESILWSQIEFNDFHFFLTPGSFFQQSFFLSKKSNKIKFVIRRNFKSVVEVTTKTWESNKNQTTKVKSVIQRVQNTKGGGACKSARAPPWWLYTFAYMFHFWRCFMVPRFGLWTYFSIQFRILKYFQNISIFRYGGSANCFLSMSFECFIFVRPRNLYSFIVRSSFGLNAIFWFFQEQSIKTV